MAIRRQAVSSFKTDKKAPTLTHAKTLLRKRFHIFDVNIEPISKLHNDRPTDKLHRRLAIVWISLLSIIQYSRILFQIKGFEL